MDGLRRGCGGVICTDCWLFRGINQLYIHTYIHTRTKRSLITHYTMQESHPNKQNDEFPVAHRETPGSRARIWISRRGTRCIRTPDRSTDTMDDGAAWGRRATGDWVAEVREGCTWYLVGRIAC